MSINFMTTRTNTNEKFQINVSWAQPSIKPVLKKTCMLQVCCKEEAHGINGIILTVSTQTIQFSHTMSITSIPAINHNDHC